MKIRNFRNIEDHYKLFGRVSVVFQKVRKTDYNFLCERLAFSGTGTFVLAARGVELVTHGEAYRA